MATVYWQGVGTTIDSGAFWGQGGNTNGYWSAEPADGDVAVMGRGNETIDGDVVALVEFAELRIGHGFTGTIGSTLAPMAMDAHGTDAVYRINSRGNVYLSLYDDAALAQSGQLIIDVASGTVLIQDYRTLSQKPTDYSHTVEVVMRSSSSSVTIAQPSGNGQPNYSRLVATGPAGSTLTLTGATAANIYTDGCKVLGGTAATNWAVLSGDIEPEGAANLTLYGGSATPGLHSSGDDIAYIDLHAGRLDLSSAEAATTFPGSWSDLEAYAGRVQMEDGQPLVNRGKSEMDVTGGVTLNIESAES